MSEEVIVIKKFKSFILGFCRCACGSTFSCYSRSGYLRCFVKGHGKTNWKGGVIIDSGYSYTYKPNHPFARPNGYYSTARLVWEEAHNAILLPWVDIDHDNEDKLDNRAENLTPRTRSQHMKRHKTIDKTGRFCLKCGGKTYINNKGFEYWFKYKDGFVCNLCKQKLRRSW